MMDKELGRREQLWHTELQYRHRGSASPGRHYVDEGRRYGDSLAHYGTPGSLHHRDDYSSDYSTAEDDRESGCSSKYSEGVNRRSSQTSEYRITVAKHRPYILAPITWDLITKPYNNNDNFLVA